MNDSAGYAVFFFPPALEALGDAIKPYLQDGPAGVHVPCREVDTGGAFIELTLQGQTNEGRDISLELMVPSAMVRMIVSARSDAEFGFYDRSRPTHVLVEPGLAPVEGAVDIEAAKPAPAVDAAEKSPAAKSDA
ncbi:MAG: hypothetical protein ABIQ62_02805 [Thermomonas sp.]